MPDPARVSFLQVLTQPAPWCIALTPAEIVSRLDADGDLDRLVKLPALNWADEPGSGEELDVWVRASSVLSVYSAGALTRRKVFEAFDTGSV